MEEVWKVVPGFNGYYEASNHGRVRNKYGLVLKTKKSGRSMKYLSVSLGYGRNRKLYKVHRIVWITFNGEIPKGMQVNHMDENPENNCLTNLNLLSARDNLLWGTGPARRAESNSKKVWQYNITGELVKTWTSVKSIEDECGYSRKNIANCCRHVPHYNTAYGYIWRYAEE